MKCKNLFYFASLNVIGGVESFYWYLVQKNKDKDIVIVYKDGNEQQLQRLRQYARVVQFKGQRFECAKAFFNYSTEIIDYVDAEEYCMIIHGDYSKQNVTPNLHPKVTRYLCASKLVADTFEQVAGVKTEVAYNPVVIPKPEKVLRLISATRLTAEKGANRMLQLAEALDKARVKFEWDVYTDSTNALPNPSIYYRKPRLDIIDYVADADYLVQLSDTEGYCFSVVEALSVGTPVIVTDCPVFKEIGVINGKNGFILDFDMKDIPVEKIAKGLPKFTYKPIEDRWSEILAPGESRYQKDLKTMVRITVTKEYFDLQLDRKVMPGEVIKTNKVRADYIIENGFAKTGGD